MTKLPTLPAQDGVQARNAWRVLALLFLANFLNVYDRIIPAVLSEPLRLEFKLNDLQLGLIGTAFTVVYALSSIPLGRLADLRSRRMVIGIGLAVWSLCTALTGMASGFVSFLLVRMGVGVGEASYAPAAHSLISDLFPRNKRSKAVGLFMLGIPLGAVIAFVTVGPIAAAFGSWRAPFYAAAIPGIVLAVAFFMVREPARGASETAHPVTPAKVANPIRTVLRVRTMWSIIVMGLGGTFSAYATNAFMMPLLQRYFHLDLKQAGLVTGALVGLSGLIALSTAGVLADKMQQRSPNGRLKLATVSMVVATVFTWLALQVNTLAPFAWLLGIGLLAGNIPAVCMYPSIQELVVPQLRSTATALFLAVMYLLGGAFGTVAVGALSDYYAEAARLADNVAALTEAHRAVGLHSAMILVPLSMAVAAVASWFAQRSYVADVNKVGIA
jgi:MFS family permease